MGRMREANKHPVCGTTPLDPWVFDLRYGCGCQYASPDTPAGP